MSRVTAAEVKEIIETELTETQVLPYITTANVLVTQALTGAVLSTAILKEIERWLSAHLIAISRERTEIEAGAGGAYIKYANVFGENLASTSYGQMVKILDTTGKMAKLGDKVKVAEIFAIPTPNYGG